MALMLVAWMVGMVTAPGGVNSRLRNTFIFCIAVPNWVYLPLPIAEALYGADGIRVILLANVGAQLLLWSLGVWILHADLSLRQALRHIALNPGLIATVLGIGVAMVVPGASSWETLPATSAPLPQLAAGTVMQALGFLGSLTVPLQLLVIGAQLGALVPKVHKPSAIVARVAAVRLVLAPAVTVGIFSVVGWCGWPVTEVTRYCLYLIAAMPVSLTTALFTERFGGDVPLGAEAIFHTTLASLLTVPLLFWLVQALGI
jgi:hypothetical protein